MTKEEQNIADVDFILSEVRRFRALAPEDIKKYLQANRGDMFTQLHDPTSGIIFCGRDAYYRFHQLADRTITESEKQTFDRDDYVKALRAAFVEQVADDKRPVNQSSVARLINHAKQLASAELVQLNHHVPCALFYETEPSQFVVGPVTFTRFEQFYGEIGNALNNYHKRCIDIYVKGERPQSTDAPTDDVITRAQSFADSQLSQLREYYSAYHWVASVTIPSCHETISRKRADRTVDAALDVLRLFVPTIPQRYRRANAPSTPLDRHDLVTDQTGKLGVTVWREGQGAPAGDGWYAELFSNEATRKIWQLFGQAIDALRADVKIDELNQRLLDALNWFGQAVIDENPGAKIVKYTAALERLTVTGHISSGIEALIIKRVALLNQGRTDATREQIPVNVGELYQCRSDLMHGTISPSHSSVQKVLETATEVTRWSLFNAVQLYAYLRERGKADRRALAFAFDGPHFPDDWLRIAAYYIWEKEAYPNGHELNHWLRAKEELTKLWQSGQIPSMR